MTILVSGNPSHSHKTAILTISAVLMEAFSQRFKNVIRSEVYHSSRTPLSERPSVSSTTDQGLISVGSAYYPRRTRGEKAQENGRPTARIRIKENTVDGVVESPPTEFQTPRAVSIEVDHLKSLIAMAKAQYESNDSESQLASIFICSPHDCPLTVMNTGKLDSPP